jgi:hypothetical protein
LFLSSAFYSHAEQVDSTTDCSVLNEIQFKINPIFDETANDAIWLHSFANFLHINTKPIALTNELAFVTPCALSITELDEIERYLRELNYIRKAKVIAEPIKDHKQKVLVETWDNWSMMPTIDFGRKGGENQYAFGVKDRNLLGLGLDAQLEYFSNAQRSGYQVKINAPLYLKQNAYVNLVFVDSDDGKQTAVIFKKPFVSLNSRHASNIGINHETRIDNIFQNGETINQFRHEVQQVSSFYGWSDGLNHNEVWRYLVGINKDKHIFEALTTPFSPFDRDTVTVWLGYEYINVNYKKLRNFYLINKIEDFNFGLTHQAKVGLIKDYTDSKAQYSWQFSMNKATEVMPNVVNITSASVNGVHYLQAKDPWYANVKSEMFYHHNERWGFYGKADFTFSNHQYIDAPVSLGGGDNGIRGFPLQYQHGDNVTLLTFETRYYPNINLYKLFEVGAVAFVDVGKASGNSTFNNIDSHLLKSVGVGARFYSTHASDSNVVHLDIAHPIGNDEKLNGVEIRIEVQHQF